MLHEFLFAERANILALCSAKLSKVQDSKSSSDEMELGLPVFYDELIEVLRADENQKDEEVALDRIKNVHRGSAMQRGKESLRLGYTISQVVHGYGALCQSITEYSTEHSDTPIKSREFNRLNFCLDVAIAEAVTEFSYNKNEATARAEVQRLGFLAHEMRNALANAATAYKMIKDGMVGVGGSTGKLLEGSLIRMKDIIDRSLSEVRLKGVATVERQRCRVIDMVGEVEATTLLEVDLKSIRLHIEVLPELEVFADRHLIISAISNLVQNAIKFTKAEGNIWIRGTRIGERVLIEVEDQCGGLPSGQIEKLFEPFTQKDEDKTGVGLGLSIARRAVSLNDGVVSARDLPGQGCVFSIELPQIPTIPGLAGDAVIPIH